MSFVLKKIFSLTGSFVFGLWQTITLALFLLLILLIRLFFWILVEVHFFKSFVLSLEKRTISFLKNFSRKIHAGRKDGIDQVDLIEFSLKNMRMRKTRTFVTIGGMTIGISIIVFLVSIGYGLQNLVVSRVAKLDQMKQAEISLHPGSKISINDQTISSIQSIPNVKAVLPLISVVGKVSYNNSVSDMVAYGVTADYLKNSDIRITQGEIFKSNELANSDAKAELPAEEISASNKQVSFSIQPNKWVKVRENSDRNSKILGYAKTDAVYIPGEEVDGGEYIDNDGSVKKNWIVATVPLWEKKKCVSANCLDTGYSPISGIGGKQLEAKGSIADVGIDMKGAGHSDSNSNVSSDANKIADANSKENNSSREAVVNQAMLKILGINETEAVGKQFSTSFVVVGNLLGDNISNKESSKMQYKIKGVIAEGAMPIFYVPFVDIRALGIVNYSQLKVVASSQEILPSVRKQIETIGFVSSSVADTVNQINTFFATTRMILGLVGMVALFVASLGMFNTLTVSLLERTREVGLLKAMGMRSGEIRNLFLTESIIMSFLGGMFGVLLGIALGKIFSTVASVYSVSMGFGILNITYVPWKLAVGIVAVSILVGFITGVYPARRAQKISALNALRYE